MDKLSGFPLFFLCLVALLTTGCEQTQEPLKLGYAGGLTGRHSDLAIYGRNGAILAVEEVNAAGGIHGRPVKLVARDNEQDVAIAKKVHQELIDAGVVAIVGHMTSTMSMAAVEVSNRNKVLMISPTTSTSSLSGLNDYFFRVMSSSHKAITRLATHVYGDAGLRRVAVVYDQANAAFSTEWLTFVEAYYAEQGEGLVIPVPYTSSPQLSFADLASEVLAHNPDGIILVSAATDAALLCQQFTKQHNTVPLFATMWSMTEDFLRNGGSSTEGIVFFHWFAQEYPSQLSQRFRGNFEQRFGHEPNFASHFAYEATMIILTALQENDDVSKLRQTIIQHHVFQGIQGEIRIDSFGDPQRKIFRMTVKNGRFLALE